MIRLGVIADDFTGATDIVRQWCTAFRIGHHHPVTPMTNANLMRLMDAQAHGRTGNVPMDVVSRGVAEIRRALAELKAKGFRYAVLDAIQDTDLKAIGAAVSDMPRTALPDPST